MKCFMYLFQVVLGVVFGWVILMGFMVVMEIVFVYGWWLFVVNLCWIVVYDIMYVMVDRDDDIKIGVKFMVVLFG